jgi:hypothetical protein
MVDAHVSGTCEAIHGGSSPLLGTYSFLYHQVEKRVFTRKKDLKGGVATATSQGSENFSTEKYRRPSPHSTTREMDPDTQ